MTYRVEFKPSANREFRRIPRQAQVRLQPRIDALAGDPRPPSAEKLTGTDDLWRIRVGDYRVIYAIRDDLLLILVVKVGHRGDVYRR